MFWGFLNICRSFGGNWGSRYSLWSEQPEVLCAESLLGWWDCAPVALGELASHVPVAKNYKPKS